MTVQSAIKQKISEIDVIYAVTKFALYLFFISDFCNKLLLYAEYDFYRVSLFSRALCELLFLAIIISCLNRSRFFFMSLLTALLVFFLVGQFVFSLNIRYQYNFGENLSILNKYFFVFIIYFSIYKLQDYPEKFLKTMKLMENLFFINSLVTLVGFVLNVGFLRTYIDQPYRFGFSGTIPAQNEATVFLFLAICFFYYKHFILKLKTKKTYVVLLSSFVLGTKAIYLFLVMLLLFHFLSHSKAKSKFVSAIFAFIIYLSVTLYLQTPHSQETLSYFIDKKQNHGLAYMLFSGRTQYLEQIDQKIISNWSFLNYFVGGQDQTKFMIEMDWFDLYFFLGAFGFLIYFILCFTTIFKFRLTKPFNLFFVFSFFVLAFMGGHFFSSAINALYLCLISMYFFITQKKLTYSHEKDFAGQ